MDKCYICDEPAVGKEHVPPRCLFPKTKDLPNGVNLRSNLMTVPSCAPHNSEKSRDDEYFLNVIAGLECINKVGREHYRRQIRRQNKRNPGILARFAVRAIKIVGNLGHKVEINRLDNFVKHLGYALYRAHFGSRWSGELCWVPEFLSRIADADPNAEQIRLAVVKENNREFKGIPYQGANPTVFSYQVLECKELCKMRLHFYEGCKMLLIFKATSTVQDERDIVLKKSI